MSPSLQDDRWMAVGRSENLDAHRAGSEAATNALAGGDDPRLLIVFASDRYDPIELLAGIRASSPETPLIGCSTAGEIASSGPGDASVIVTALGGPGFTVTTSVATGASSDLRGAGATAASALAAVDGRTHRVLMLLADGLAGDQQEIVRGAYEVAGAAVPLVGGCAGDDMRMVATRQFFGDDVLTDAVVVGRDRLRCPVRHRRAPWLATRRRTAAWSAPAAAIASSCSTIARRSTSTSSGSTRLGWRGPMPPSSRDLPRPIRSACRAAAARSTCASSPVPTSSSAIAGLHRGGSPGRARMDHGG